LARVRFPESRRHPGLLLGRMLALKTLKSMDCFPPDPVRYVRKMGERTTR
jgi:hypothetical protein